VRADDATRLPEVAREISGAPEKSQGVGVRAAAADAIRPKLSG
jgi:hypothetical protein